MKRVCLFIPAVVLVIAVALSVASAQDKAVSKPIKAVRFGKLWDAKGRLWTNAIVIVETPSNLSGLLRQRRRIVRGHRQVVRLLGRRPSTLEGLVRSNPALAARILISELTQRPAQAFAFLSLGGPLELISHLFSFVDRTRNSAYPVAWPMVD